MLNSLRRYHFFYLRKGFYKFLRGISLKFLLVIGVVLAAMALFEHYTPGLAYYFAQFTEVVAREWVLAFFFFSETALGVIPPDLFIVWADQFHNPWTWVAVLAVLSYLAGLLSYYMGLKLLSWRQFAEYFNLKFGKYFTMLRSWGGFLIVVAALFPLPFSVMCMGAGLLQYNFKTLAILGTFRIVRFFVYATFIFQMI
jgi:membrane protein YqaA with SNARE-associated domain